MLGTPQVHGLMSAAALLGPGREVLAAGWRAAAAGSPDMNTLVGLGASAAFGVSCVAAALPALGWRTFFEEPAMLLGVVLLGRTLERRAKLQASADMAALRVGLAPSVPGGSLWSCLHAVYSPAFIKPWNVLGLKTFHPPPCADKI